MICIDQSVLEQIISAMEQAALDHNIGDLDHCISTLRSLRASAALSNTTGLDNIKDE